MGIQDYSLKDFFQLQNTGSNLNAHIRDWLNKPWYTHTMEYNVAIKKWRRDVWAFMEWFPRHI